MINNNSILAIILARSGSKRLPDKNILPLKRKPLILWSIQAGLNSEYVDRVVVSSNDNNILNIIPPTRLRRYANYDVNVEDINNFVINNLNLYIWLHIHLLHRHHIHQ